MSNAHLLHRQVTDHIRERIERGTIQSGSRMPSERVLSEQFGVSRVTIRQALKDLESLGLVEVNGGIRWVRRATESSLVSRSTQSIEEGATGLVSFSDLAAANGLTVSSVVLSIATRPSTLDEADLLNIAPGASIVDMVRLRHLDGIPIVVDFSLIPEGPVPGLGDLDFSSLSLYGTLAERYGLHAVSAECAIEARGVSPELAGHLGLSTGDPVLEIIQTTFGEDRRVLQWCRSIYRGDRYRFRAGLEGSAGAQLAHRTAAEPRRGAQSIVQ